MLQGITRMTLSTREATSDLLILQFKIVNAFLFGKPGGKTEEWVLIDTAIANTDGAILKTSEERFGKGSRPKAIILTHGHFDHVGTVADLADKWDVPVYVHPLEMPYVTGKKDYPSGDPTVDGGMVAELSPAFPNKSINLGHRAVEYPSDGTVPGMHGWRWIHTPGHTPGHVSLFRDSDRVLIPGDAFTTVKQESLTSVLTQHKDVNGPPAYFTTDWEAAEKSVKFLADLKPSLVVPSHGQPMQGEELNRSLENLARHFDEIAVPEHGRFVEK